MTNFERLCLIYLFTETRKDFCAAFAEGQKELDLTDIEMARILNNMKAQACQFKRTQDGPRVDGVAILNWGFGTADVMTIVDYNGEVVPKNKMYNYWLMDGPLSYIDTQYRGT